MSNPPFDAIVGRERARLTRFAQANPGIAYLGYETGQLSLQFDPAYQGVDGAEVLVTTLPPIPKERAPYYHAVVHRTDEAGVPAPCREVFRHPFPALDWIHEMVPDFDLVKTVCVGGPEEEQRGDSGADGSGWR